MSTSRAIERIQHSKLLRPGPGIWELRRARLLDRLNEGRSAPLSIICGMAGSGKTTLARQWAAQLDCPVAWITLDEGDNTLGRFVHLLVAAVRTIWPQFGAATLGELRIGDRLSAGDLAVAFCDEVVAFGAPVVVVIDELQAVRSTEIFDFLARVFRLPPANLHICLVSRTDPPLPLVRYRAHYHLTEIRLAQLLLSLDETREFLLDIAHAPLSSETVRKLHDETEGWITGLHLTAIAIRDAENELDTSILHQRASLDSMEFLANEVIERVPVSMQRRLLLLSVPERINAELSWHLLETSPDDDGVDVEALLRQLEASGYFLVSLGDDRTWYRFHPLFRDALLDATTRRFGAETIRTGHRLAADWFSANHYIDQAIRHSLAAGDIGQAAGLVEQHAQHALATDNWLALEWWIQQLPESIQDQRIEIVMAQAWIHQLRGTHSAIAERVQRARTLLGADRQRSADDRAALEAELELLAAIAAPNAAGGDFYRRTGAKAWAWMAPRNRAGAGYALYYLTYGHVEENRWDDVFSFLDGIGSSASGNDDAFTASREMWVQFCAGLVRLWHGDLDEAEAHSQRVLVATEAAAFPRMTAQSQYVLGAVCVQRNQLDRAQRCFREAAAEPLTGILIKWEALSELARTATLLGDDLTADHAVSRLFDTLYSLGWTSSIPAVRALQADMALLRGDITAAARWAETTTPDPARGALAVTILPALIRARILLSESMPSPQHLREAAAILDVLDQRLQTQHIHRVWIAVRTLRAVQLDLAGFTDQALRLLAETIDAARGHVRPFLDQGPHVSALLERLVRRDGNAGMRVVLLEASRAEIHRRTPAMMDPAAPLRTAEPPAGAEALSMREREILGFLAARRSNKEIAQELGISPLTVKRHTINLYAKLGVSGRREAVRAYYRSP